VGRLLYIITHQISEDSLSDETNLCTVDRSSRPRDLSSVDTPSTLVRPQCRPRKRGALHNQDVGEAGRTRPWEGSAPRFRPHYRPCP
jgi:hypothetical protein